MDKSDVIEKIVFLLCKSTNMERQYHNEKTKRTCATQRYTLQSRIYLNRTAGGNRCHRFVDGNIDACTTKGKGTSEESFLL